jgi:hypothetical protein
MELGGNGRKYAFPAGIVHGQTPEKRTKPKGLIFLEDIKNVAPFTHWKYRVSEYLDGDYPSGRPAHAGSQ